MVPFSQIPTNLRVPLFYAEVDNSHANTLSVAQRTLLIGQKSAAGTLTANVPVISRSQSDSRGAAGDGSILASMVDAYRANDAAGEMWLGPLADDAGGTAATGSITFGGPSTAPGTLSLYIAGRRVPVALSAGMTAAQIATAVAAAISSTKMMPVTAAVDGTDATKVNLTARNKGECGTDIDVRLNYRGWAAGERTPTGVTATIVAMAGGATNPSLTTLLTNLQDQSFDFIICSLTDATSLAAIAALLNDATGRWSWEVQVYGHCFIAKRGSAGTLASFATALNNQHISCVGFAGSPSPQWDWSAAFAGASALSLRADPGVPLQPPLTVTGVLAPPLAERFSLTIRNNTLLYGGVATWIVDPTGNIQIENMVTTYVTNDQAQPDDSYLEIERLFLIMYVLRQLRAVVADKYSRKKLAANGTRLLPGSNAITPNVVRADLIAKYRELEGAGMVQNAEEFGADLVVEQNADNPDRLDVLYPAVLINQLRVFAVLFQFRLV